MKLGDKVQLEGVVTEICDHGHDVNCRISSPKGGPEIWMMGASIKAFAPARKPKAEPTADKPKVARKPAKKATN